MAEHFPILVVIVPAFISFIVFMLSLSKHRLEWPLTVVAATLSFLIALALLYRVIQTGPISYRLGGWAPPWGIEYRIDYFSGFMLVTVALVVFVTSVYAGKSILGSGSLTREIIGVEGEVPFFTLYLFTHGCRRPWWPRRRSVRCCMP